MHPIQSRLWRAVIRLAAFGLTLSVAACPSETDPDAQGLDPDHFPDSSLATAIETQPCVLTDGTSTTCYRIRITGAPTAHEVGPFCPAHISDGANAGGLWIDGGEVYDLTGGFIEDLATFYDDDEWQLHDPATGDIYLTETKLDCAGAAQPIYVPEALRHRCIDCLLSYVDGGMEVSYLIPTRPVPLDAPAELLEVGDVGVSLNGVGMAAPAPIEAILANYTIAAFDDCMGHVNMLAGYHYHGAGGCGVEVAQDDGHAPLIGYARDGYGIYGQLDANNAEPDDLDSCRGHSDDGRGYHYHSAGPGENLFIGCFRGAQALAF